MTLQSMTGFASASGTIQLDNQSPQSGVTSTLSWTWEMRSVNGKTLDLRLRTPPGFDSLESDFRSRLSALIGRGTVHASLAFDGGPAAPVPVLNEAAFDAALEIVNRAAQKADQPFPGLDAVLAMRGIVEFREPVLLEAEREARDTALLESFETCARELKAARIAEGKALAGVLLEQVDEIEQLTKAVEHDPSRSPEAIGERIAAQIAKLADSNGLDPDRLHGEAVLLATKADLQEELDRLTAHIASARALISEGGVIGRKLDFLAQEFNRECNTICSKSNAVAVTQAGMEMKVIVDRFREQVQNVQ